MRTLSCTVTCKKYLLLKIELLHFKYSKMELLHLKHNLRASLMQALGENWSCQASRMLLTSFSPAILSRLGNILVIAKRIY